MTKIIAEIPLDDTRSVVLDSDGRVWLNTRQYMGFLDRPQSSREPAGSPQTTKPEPSPDKPKRGPGRPRKLNIREGQIGSPGPIPNHDLLGDIAKARMAEEEKVEDAEFRQCRICGQEIVATIFGVHFENCRAARQGYTSHQANPGKP